jgi:predicted ribosome quality control (RQC) complex YloA/Tae2 family protein
MLDEYFEGRDREVRVKQKATDILKILTNSESRLIKKMDKQRAELEDCKQGEKYKKQGDLITSNIYAIERGMKRVELIDYESYDEESGEFDKVVIELDSRLGDRSSQHPGSAFLGNKLFLTLATEAQHRQVQNFVSKTRVTRQSDKAEKTV